MSTHPEGRVLTPQDVWDLLNRATQGTWLPDDAGSEFLRLLAEKGYEIAPATPGRVPSLPYQCFICFEPMTDDQELLRNGTGVVTHRACMEDDDDD